VAQDLFKIPHFTPLDNLLSTKCEHHSFHDEENWAFAEKECGNKFGKRRKIFPSYKKAI
jgi:5-methylcytosine-specific restriction endonuclease McrA